MKAIENNCKSGFFCSEKFVRILDEYGQIFYYKRNKGRGIYFNLPTGIYFSENNLKRLKKPVPYKLIKLPLPERYMPERKLNVTVGDNPSKCSVCLRSGNVLLDHKIHAMPIPVLAFILSHEKGHYLYRTEWKCDAYARNEMLKAGYNPSQIAMATETTLKDSDRRKRNFDGSINSQIKNKL